MSNFYFDTETCGFHGMPVLLQYAVDDNPDIILYDIWKHPIRETLNLIEWITDQTVIGFNLVFDWFHLVKTYNTFRLHSRLDEYPLNLIDELAILEKKARDGVCLKPAHAFDVMLHARKGPYQSTMDRGDIRIKKVPTALAFYLSKELEERIPLKDIYFARRKNKYASKWQVFDTDDPGFKDVVLKFHPSNSLKALAVDALGINSEDLLLFEDIEIGKNYLPTEKGYAPFALAVGIPGNWNGAWPEKIIYHIEHWARNFRARKYAMDDVKYTRGLYHHFADPPVDDDDSILSCAVANMRWKGYKINVETIKQLRSDAITKSLSAPTAPNEVRQYIYRELSETERVVIQDSTKKVLLEEIAEYLDDNGDPHPAAKLAQAVLDARFAKYEINFYEKLIEADRLMPDFNVIGALSSRMSGSGGINAQGIKGDKKVRKCFQLAFNEMILCGGDFDGFEVTIAEAAFKDPKLREQLQTVIDCPYCDGKGSYPDHEKKLNVVCSECEATGKHKQTLHGLFGTFVFDGYDYVGILKTKGTAKDLYFNSKRAVFAMIYGGNDYTLKERLGVPLERAQQATKHFMHTFPGIAITRNKIQQDFNCLSQPEGIGSRVYWSNPKDFIESLNGFKRYFTLENQICRLLFELAEAPPKEWEKVNIIVKRREREQTASGAVRSALFAAAFALQESTKRAATNHIIQSSGAIITKGLQRRIWDVQPQGIHGFKVMPMNVHDEVEVPCRPEYVEQITKIVHKYVDEQKALIPLLEIKWKVGMKDWSEK